MNLNLRALVDQSSDQRAGDDLVADAPVRPDKAHRTMPKSATAKAEAAN